MSKVNFELTPSTINAVVVFGMLSAYSLDAIPTNFAVQNVNTPFLHTAYAPDSNVATSSMFRESLTGQYVYTPFHFEQQVSDFYTKLITSQEHLGANFAKVLHDNLWDLYES